MSHVSWTTFEKSRKPINLCYIVPISASGDQPQQISKYMALPVWIIPAGCQSLNTLVQCRGAKSHVYDMFAGQGVVSSRAVSVYCDLLRISSDRVFCIYGCMDCTKLIAADFSPPHSCPLKPFLFLLLLLFCLIYFLLLLFILLLFVSILLCILIHI
uniref:Uncharacterized protein n=1 Tax=Angiostrongylus cantonensis TaxID=6313 RepID=A0A0K0D9K3_ANGCA